MGSLFLEPQRTMTDKPFLSIEDVAKHFGVNTTTVYRLAQRGQLPGFKVGGQWRFNRDMLEAWVADQVRGRWSGRPMRGDSDG